MAQDMAVMYTGRIVEQGSVEKVFSSPLHPYTEGLLESIPRLDGAKKQLLHAIEGMVPDLSSLPAGCTFAGRCPYSRDLCRVDRPALKEHSDGRFVSCHFPLGGES
jgi:oligopeptide/dipeptide ABC transporter ATP-binding protein